MKKTLFYSGFLILSFFVISPSSAQQGGGNRRNMDPEEMAQRQTSQMKESLKLTAEQMPELEALNLLYAEKFKVARDEVGDDRESMRSTMMEMMKVKDIEMKKILTAEQWTKFEAERKERMQNRGGGRRGI